MQDLPEYLRDYTKDEEPMPKHHVWGLVPPHLLEAVFSDQEIREQDKIYEGYLDYSDDHTSRSYLDIREEYDRQERNGENSWLQKQQSPRNNPTNDSNLTMIHRIGYNHTYRGKRPSLIFKSILVKLNQLANTGEQESVIRSILNKLNFDPATFVEQTYRYKRQY
jgi:hypothetical protein